MPKYSRRIGSATTSPLSAAEIQGVVRRFGYILAKAHEVIISRLIANQDDRLAEVVNDTLKPVVDWLLHFDLNEQRKDYDGPL